MIEKDERSRALVQKRKIVAKHEKDQIREISKEIKKCITNKEAEKTGKLEDPGQSQGYKEHFR